MYLKIKDSLKTAMKDKQESRKVFYKNFKSFVDSDAKDKQVEISDELISNIAKKQIKNNLKLIKIYITNNRIDLSTKLERENKIYSKFLPPVKSIEETDMIINKQFVGIEIGLDFNINKTRGIIMKNLSSMKNELDWNYVIEQVNKKLNDMVSW